MSYEAHHMLPQVRFPVRSLKILRFFLPCSLRPCPSRSESHQQSSLTSATVRPQFLSHPTQTSCACTVFVTCHRLLKIQSNFTDWISMTRMEIRRVLSNNSSQETHQSEKQGENLQIVTCKDLYVQCGVKVNILHCLSNASAT